MWDDLISYYKNGDKNPYFLGSMVLIQKDIYSFDVIDGQQRLSTLILLFASIKCFLTKNLNENTSNELANYLKDGIENINELLFNKAQFGITTIEKKVVVHRNPDGFDYDLYFKKVVDCEQLSIQNFEKATDEQKRISKRYFDNRDFFEGKLSETFLKDNTLSLEGYIEINKFIDFLKSRVVIVRILTGNFEMAYHIFEILNNRGLPLANKDLFRNFIIKEFAAIGDKNPNQKWIDLEEEFSFSDDFLGRWVESTKGGQQKYSSYNDITEIYKHRYTEKPGKKKIELFYEDFKSTLPLYEKIVNIDFTTPFFKTKINFILNVGNLRYSMNLLFSLLRNTQGDIEQNEFAKIIISEYDKYLNYCFHYGRYSSKPVYNCINLINKLQWEEAKSCFKESYSEVDLTKTVYNSLFYSDNDTPKLLLAKYLWYKNFKLENNDLVKVDLIYSNCTLEHIMPQNCRKGSNWEKDFSPNFRDVYTYKLGNMTLLTKKINSAAKNYDLEKKKEEYKKTNLAMTLELANLNVPISEEFIKNRHYEIVQTLIEEITTIY
ncbi:MAG: DUF262 domain-containing protein [Cytophagales bacterium]|nr:MAG: DUF262 domain-containing protein [Cytophagales bacterium]